MARRRTVGVAGVTIASVAILAACAPLTPPPYATPVPVEATPSASTEDGFEGAELIALRVWATTCEAYVNGTAWMLDSTHAVTNRHVVEGSEDIELTDYQGNEYHVTGAEMSTSDDLAMVTIEGTFPRVATIGTDAPSVGDTLSVSGFARGGPLGTVEGPLLGTVDDDLDPDGAPIYSIQVEVREGNSGSPVTDADGAVVGVIFSSDGNTVGGAVTLASLTAFLTGETPRENAMTSCS